MSIVKMRTAAIFLVAMFCAGSSDASRIAPPSQPQAFRCNTRELTHRECEEDRNDAVAIGCITHGELQEIKNYNGCPVCKRREYMGWCPVGCFVRGTKLLVWDSATNAQALIAVEDIVQESSRYHMIALNKGSTRSALDFAPLPIKFTVVGPETQPLVIITTKNQRTLGLSSEHAVLLSNGKLVKADSLRVDDSLITSEGNVDVIINIARPHTDDVVFNIAVDTDDDQSHLIIAEGLLVGDQFLQGANRQNSTILN